MRIKPMKLHTNDLDAVVNFTIERVKFVYESHTEFMSVLLSESFHLRNMSGQVEAVVFKLKENYIHIDILAGGGGTGLLNLNWGAERSSISSIVSVLQEFAAERNVELEFMEV